MPTVITIGNFDGVHLGHQALLSNAKASARAHDLILTLLTFKSHPHEFLHPKTAPLKISLLRDQVSIWKKFGVDRAIIIPFERESFANISANNFVTKVLIQILKTKILWIGDDFHYGANKVGDYQTLKDFGKIFNFQVHRLETIYYKNDFRISSTAIRQALINGNLNLANRLLGYKYTMTGHVIHGKKLGRILGFPTLNIAIHRGKSALVGVLVVRVLGLDNTTLMGVAHLSNKSITSNHSKPRVLEVHVLNWSGNAYGKIVTIEFLHKLHNSKQYLNVNALTAGIAEDIELAKNWLITTASQQALLL